MPRKPDGLLMPHARLLSGSISDVWLLGLMMNGNASKARASEAARILARRELATAWLEHAKRDVAGLAKEAADSGAASFVVRWEGDKMLGANIPALTEWAASEGLHLKRYATLRSDMMAFGVFVVGLEAE